MPQIKPFEPVMAFMSRWTSALETAIDPYCDKSASKAETIQRLVALEIEFLHEMRLGDAAESIIKKSMAIGAKELGKPEAMEEELQENTEWVLNANESIAPLSSFCQAPRRSLSSTAETQEAMHAF